jgi:tetratricopeptide (TPR) repeat protein
MNQFGDHTEPSYLPTGPQSDNTVKVVLIVLAAVFGCFVLMCGGMLALGFMAFRSMESQMERQLAEAEIWDEMNGLGSSESMQRYNQSVANGDYATALEIVNEAIEEDPGSAGAHNNKAWLLATCPADDVRDGPLAIKHAERACELTDYENFMFLDTLAAAHAEAGAFDEAVRYQRKAIDLMPEGYVDEGFQDRLKLFELGRPYREGVVPQENEVSEVPGDVTTHARNLPTTA